MKKFIFMSSVLAVALLFTRQKATAQQIVWKYVTEQQMPRNDDYRTVHPQKYLTYQLDVAALKSLLAKAPMEFTENAKTSPVILNIPMPNGEMQRFSIVEYAMQEPELAAKYPEIKNYRGNGIDDPHATIHLGWNYFGFHAIILSGSLEQPVQIDPYFKNNQQYYLSYSLTERIQFSFEEQGEYKSIEVPFGKGITAKAKVGNCVGDTLRTYKLAVSCTGEYAVRVCQGIALSKANVLSAINTAITRVNGIYEKEVSIRFTLVNKEDTIIFLNPATDPYAQNGNASAAMPESQNVIDSLIQDGNYDLGHLFITSNGGVVREAGVVCVSGKKAQAVTGRASPIDDTFYVGYVAHEFGHQFGANHTWNSSTGAGGGCPMAQRNGPTAVEPGSGVTIMSYQGLCGAYNNIEPHLLNLPVFHAVSLDEIVAWSKGTANACATKTPTGNDIPVVNAGQDVSVPISTPFTLTGSATDNHALVYSWEEVDPGAASGNWDNGNKPFFRSFAPSAGGNVRTFPKLGAAVKGETLPATAQTLNFRLTARDNRAGGGGTCSENITVTVVAGAAFRVTSQPVATNWTGNGVNTAIISWDVANTNAAPFNCDSVQIYLSTDSGYTFPTLIKTVRNIGNDTIIIPSIATTRGRIMVRGKGKVFYSINVGVITINVCAKPSVSIRTSDTTICPTKKVTFTANVSNVTDNPIYQWKKNGNNVGGNNLNFIDSALANGDSVWLVVTSNDACKITGLTSNKIKIKVKTVRPIAITCPLNATICVGDTIRFTANPAGGVWSQLGRVTINETTGLMTGTSGGTTTIKYTITDSGCSNTASCSLVVVAALPTPSIVYAPGTTSPQTAGGFCTNRTFTLIGNPTGGTWSSTGVVSVTNAGVVSTGAVAGAASVTYTYGAGSCKGSRTIAANIVACASRGISSSNQTINYTLYPNPAHSFVNLKMDRLTTNGSIVITDLYGKELRRQLINSKQQTLNIESLGKGLYFVTIITSENTTTEKLLIE